MAELPNESATGDTIETIKKIEKVSLICEVCEGQDFQVKEGETIKAWERVSCQIFCRFMKQYLEVV